MSDTNDRWNPDDGPPPTDEEMLAASRLAEALDKGAPTGLDLDTAALVSTALRVRAVERPDATAARAVADRGARDALAAHRRAWWSRGPRLRIAAAAVLAAAGAGGGAYLAARSPATVTAAEGPRAVFDAPVEPGAGSAPSTHLYDHGLRSYRAALLGGDR
jgi:hypothetical protein